MEETKYTEQKRFFIFLSIIICCGISSMLSVALSTILPPIATDLRISDNTTQWLSSGYNLVIAIITPLTAFLITRFPTKRLFCCAVLFYEAGIVLCIAAVNFPMLMSGRILQAVGSGLLTAMAMVVILTIYPAEQRGKAMGWYGLVLSAGPVISPTLAGIVSDYLGWRMVFVCVAVILLAALVFALFVFEDVLETGSRKFDISSFLLSIFAFGGLTLGIGNIGSSGLFSTPVLLMLGIGILSTVFFCRRQLRLTEPLLELRVLRDRTYRFGLYGCMLLYFINMGYTMLLSLYVQRTLGLSSTIAGLVTMPGILVSAVLSPYIGGIFDKFGVKKLLPTGALLMFLGCVPMGFVSLNVSVWLAAVINVIRNAASTCLQMPLVTWGTSAIDQKNTSHATALMSSLRTMAGSIGSAVFVAIMTGVAAGSVQSYGEKASIHGVNVAFLAMAAASLGLIVIAVAGTRQKK